MNAMPVTEMIVGISGGLFLLAAFLGVLRLIQAWLLHRTLREAIGRDSAIAPSLIDKLESGQRRDPLASGDDRTGLVLLAIGVALLGFAWIVGAHDWAQYVAASSLFPMLIGAALFGRHLLQVRAHRRRVAEGA